MGHAPSSHPRRGRALVALGEALVDLVPVEPGSSIGAATTFAKVAGGAPANVAAGVARLGGEARLLGKVGKDALGDFLLAELAAAGVSTSSLRRDPSAQTVVALVSLDPTSEHGFEFYGSPAAHWQLAPDEVTPSDLSGAGALHFGSISLVREPSRSATWRALELAEASGLTVSFDPNLRLALWPSPDAAREAIHAAAERATLIKLSRQELRWLTGADEPARLAGPVTRLIAVTDGAAGVELWSGGEGATLAARVGAPEVKAVDATGAGDAFMAALLNACLLDDGLLTDASTSGRQRLLAAVSRATAFAALSTTRRGGVPAMPTASELQAFMDRQAIPDAASVRPAWPGSDAARVVDQGVSTIEVPTYADIEAAAAVIRGIALRTRLVRLPFDLPGGDAVYAKPESLQRTGSFKIRGALNVLANLTDEQRARGVVAHSSGNHAQGVAAAARHFGVAATIVIPRGASELKVRRTLALGATVIRCEDTQEAREGEAAKVVVETGATLVHPYDNPRIVAGQGTAGLEIAVDLPDVANVIVPIGGGGLASGVALALATAAPNAQVLGVEPELAADARDSLAAGEVRSWPATSTTSTMADGVRTQSIGALNLALLTRHLTGVVTVTEAAIAAATRWYHDEAHLVVEPTGALSLAALRRLTQAGDDSGLKLRPGPTVLFISGGNVDNARLAALLADDA